MKLKFWFLIFGAILATANAHAANDGIRTIVNRGLIICGTDLSSKTLAYKDADGFWQGIDADICRNFAEAILGNDKAFRLKDTNINQASKALTSGQIDIMLGNTSLSARQEISSAAEAIDVLYYDRQVFAARNDEAATSMEDFKGAKVCVADNSGDQSALNEYNHRYALELRLLQFATPQAAKEAFLLNRCQLISGGEIYLKGLSQSLVSKDKGYVILPETIAHRPVFAYSAKGNPNLRIIGKWIINAPKLAEQQGISARNLEAFSGVRDASLRNLLGADPKLWTGFGLRPDWVKNAVLARGNYGEMLERDLGAESPLQIERDKNHLIEKGGLISAQPFI